MTTDFIPGLRYHATGRQDNDIARTGRLLQALALIWRRQLSRDMANLHLTEAQWAVIETLARDGDGIKQLDVARRLGVEKSALVRVLSDLEAKGLVLRPHSSDDGRQRLVYLTPDGEAISDKVGHIIERFEAPVLAALSPPEIETMLAAMQKLYDRLEAQTEVNRKPS